MTYNKIKYHCKNFLNINVKYSKNDFTKSFIFDSIAP